MKQNFFVIIFLLYFLFVNNNKAIGIENKENDKITTFLMVINKNSADYIKQYKYIQIVIYKNEKNKIKWMLKDIDFWYYENGEKETIIDMKVSSDNDIKGKQLLKNIKWFPGRKLICDYYGMSYIYPMKLIAQKVEEKKYKWKVYCYGQYKLKPNNPKEKEKFWELKSIDSIELKYKKLVMPSLYYK